MESWSNVNTFKDIFNICLSLDNKENMKDLLSFKSEGKDILETILRLFAYTNCLSSKKEWKACSGNFNLGTIQRENKMFNLFYEIKNNNISLKKIKDSGDSSDLTIMDDRGNIITFTSKNLSKKNMKFNNMDIDKLLMYASEYNVKVKLGVCCREEQEFQTMVNKCKDTTITKGVKKLLSNATIIDKNKLVECWNTFKHKFKDITFDEIINSEMEEERNNITFRPHQEYAINKSLHLIRKYALNEDKSKRFVNILWGHIARSGKSYMMFGLVEQIFKSAIEKNRTSLNICIITTAPNETINQYLEIMKSLITDSSGSVNIITSMNQLTEEGRSDLNKNGFNLFIFSKQLLTHKDNKKDVIKLFNSKEYKVSLLIADEIHHGGSTILSKDLLDKCFKKCHKIFVTATYNKVKYNFDIHETIKWSLEDINIMKTQELSMIYSDAIEFVQESNMKSEDYKLYPKLSVIGVDNFQDIDIKSVFESKNKTELTKMINYTIHYIIYRLNQENIEINQRMLTGNKFNKMPVIIIFLPSLNISKTSKLLTEVINEVNSTIEVCSCNTTDSNISFKQTIENAQKVAINLGRSYVIALTGTQGHLGVSVEDCDLVILMNDSNSLDFVFQSMFRCMTESKIGNKQVGYVVDFNLKRSIFSMLEYANNNVQSDSDIQNLEKIIKNEVIDFRFSSNMDILNRNDMFGVIQNYYNSIKMTRIDYYMNKMNSMDLELVNIISKDMLDKIKKLKTHIVESKNKKELVFTDSNSENKDSAKSDKDSNSSGNSSNILGSEIIKATEITYFISSIKYLTPLCCILTINEECKSKLNLLDMLLYIQRDSNLSIVLKEQFSTWCGKEVTMDNIEDLTSTLNDLSLENKSFKQQVEDVSSTIKLLFLEAKGDMKEMAKLVEKHLTPSTLEKKKNAEVSTPDKLCKEMLEPLKEEIQKEFKDSNGKINRIYKILEPCCGKGIFLLNIYNFLVENSTLSKKQILEECIYFADISPLNIFICKLLLNPNDEYKLNFQLGDSLKMKWDEAPNGFDAVIGNPPYQKNYNNLNGRVGGSSLWSEFLNYYIGFTKKYLLFITPCSWMTGGSNKQSGNILNGVFKENTLLYLDIENCGKDFKVASTFSYYLIQKNKTDRDITCVCMYKKKIYKSIIKQQMFRNLSAIPKLLCNESISIINKVENKCSNKFNFVRKRDLDSSAKTKLFEPNGKYIVKHKVVELKYTNYFQENVMNIHKVVISMPGYIKPSYDYESGVTDATLYHIVDNEKSAKYIIEILNSNLYQFIINSYRELTGLNNHKNINRLCLPLNVEIENLYSYFNLNEEEIYMINNF